MAGPSQFLRHAATMLTGVALAQAIPLIVAPFLTRLYSPTEFGVFASVVAAAGVLSIFATLRYELAVVLPKEESTAANLVIATLGWSTAFCGAMFLVVIFFPDLVQGLFSQAADSSLLAIPLLTLALAWTQVFSFIANRQREYWTLASSAVVQQTAAGAVGVAAGLAAAPWNGLILARIVAQIVVCSYLMWSFGSYIRRCFGLNQLRQLFSTVWTYRQFLLFNTPYSLVGMFSREFIVLALTALHQLSAAGFYGLARSVIMVPITFLSSSLSQVFYKEAAVSIGTPEFKRLTLATLRYIGAGLSPFFVLGWMWGPEVFAFVFGAQWREAGIYASTLMPIAFLSLFTSWPERVFEVRQKQYVSLTIQLCFDVASIAAIWIALARGLPPLAAIVVYVAIQCGYHLVYLFAVFSLSGLTGADYARFVGTMGLMLAAAVALQVPTRWIVTSLWVQFGISVAIAIVLALILLLACRKWAVASGDVTG